MGDRRRHGPMGDGQMFEWWKVQGLYGGTTVCLLFQPPVRLGVAESVAALRDVVDRHEALRTTFYLDGHGIPQQLVHPPGALPIPIENITDQHHRERFLAASSRHDFDIERGPLGRIGMVTDGHFVTELIIVFSHTVLDGGSIPVITTELAELLRARFEGTPPALRPVACQALDIVSHERSDPDLRSAVEEYWRTKLRHAPTRLFVSRPHTEFSLYVGELTSTTAPARFAAAARQHRVTPSVIYMALVHAVLAILSGTDRVLVRTHLDGRDTRSAMAVGCFHQILFTTLDLADRPAFDELVRRMWAERLALQKNQRIDYLRLRELETAETRRRGGAFAWGSTINVQIDAATDRRLLGIDPASVERHQPPVPRSPVRMTRMQRGDVGMDAYFSVALRPTTMYIEGSFNGDVLEPKEMERLLWGPEEILRKALGNERLSFAEMAGCLYSDGNQGRAPVLVIGRSIVDTDQITDVLERHPSVEASLVVHEDDVGGRRLVAFVASLDPALDPYHLRASVLAQAKPTSSTICPHHFVICAAAPADRRDVRGWRSLPRRREGSGRFAGWRPPAGKAEQALRNAVMAFHNQLTDVNMASTYLEAGGRLLVVPALLRSLADAGYVGLAPEDFTLPSSLSRLAAGLTRSAPPAQQGPPADQST
jgi:hypothetical protein